MLGGGWDKEKPGNDNVVQKCVKNMVWKNFNLIAFFFLYFGYGYLFCGLF